MQPRWRGPLVLLGEIGAAPTYDDLLALGPGFESAARWFRRATFSRRRDARGRMWHGRRELRSDVREPESKKAMQEVVEVVVNDPVFDAPPAADMRARLIELRGVNWTERTP
jgi:hypothetical protein